MRIVINHLRLYAFHGVLPQERQVGAYFIIDLKIDTDFSRAMESDELEGTISYADVFNAVKDEMSRPSRLLEHVGGRIVHRLFTDFPTANAIHLSLIKENPPMGADCDGAGIEICASRDQHA